MRKSEIILTIGMLLIVLGLAIAVVITTVNSGKHPPDVTDPISVTDTAEPDSSGDADPEPPKDVYQPNHGDSTTEEPDIDVGSITRPKDPSVIGGDVEYGTKE